MPVKTNELKGLDPEWLSIDSFKVSLNIWADFSHLLFTVTYFSITHWHSPPPPPQINLPVVNDKEEIILSVVCMWLAYPKGMYAQQIFSYTLNIEKLKPASLCYEVLLGSAPWKGNCEDIHRLVPCCESSLIWCLLKQGHLPGILLYILYILISTFLAEIEIFSCK